MLRFHFIRRNRGDVMIETRFMYFQNNELMTSFSSSEQAISHMIRMVHTYPNRSHRVEKMTVELLACYRGKKWVTGEAKDV
nr:MAG TPA: hypothetical protein [Caudoviricetes sp.]